MRLLSLALTAALVLTGCSGESACDRYERLAEEGKVDDQSASLEEQAEGTEALAECMAEDPERSG